MAKQKLIDIKVNREELNTLVAADFREQQAREIIISDLMSYEFAANMVGDITSRISEREEARKKVKAPILEAGRKIDAMFKVPIKQGEAVKAIIIAKMKSYQQQVRMDRIKAEEDANKEAQKIKQSTEDKALSLMSEGKEDEAQEILDDMDMAPTPAPVVADPKVKGVSSRTNWKADLTDMRKLIAVVAKGKAPINLLMLDSASANRFAKVIRDTLTVPGLQIYNDETLIVRKSKLPTSEAF